MEGGFLMDVVVTKGAAILELFASKDETLLIWRDAFLVLNLNLHIVNGVTWLNLNSRSQCYRIPFLGVDNKQLYVWKLLSKKISVLLRGSYNLFPFIITTTLWRSTNRNVDNDTPNTTEHTTQCTSINTCTHLHKYISINCT